MTGGLIGLRSSFAEEGTLETPKNLTSGYYVLDPLLTAYVSNGANVTYSVKTTAQGSRLHGVFLVTDKRDTRLFQGHYKNGQLHGEYRGFHPNGVLESIGHYNEGRMEGIERYWDTRGGVIRTANYVRGEKEGLESYYSAKDKVSLRIKWKNGEPTEITLFDNGKKSKTLTGDGALQFLKHKALQQLKTYNEAGSK